MPAIAPVIADPPVVREHPTKFRTFLAEMRGRPARGQQRSRLQKRPAPARGTERLEYHPSYVANTSKEGAPAAQCAPSRAEWCADRAAVGAD
jgi:hypothetical protein